ncbi:MAG TPA: hypothetical protein VMD25_13700 [Acidobacteriaceae bacterium]|nr:hypothetical protein [Acidobacteriaceae bacterium]
MKYEAWAAAEKNAVAAINAFAKLGIHVQAGDPNSTPALLQVVRARAFDAHHTTAPRGESDLYPVDRVEDADDDLDPEDLKKLLADIEAELSAGTLGKHSQFFAMLARQIKGYLSAGKDSDTQRARAMRAQMDAASRVTGKASNVDPWGNYEAGATDQERRHLARSRRLAGRATDAKPAPGKSFLGRRPERGTDLDKLDRQAARTFNL